ncbi:hypothetical protein GGR54DRAFT_637855 [Hypoxylon sp. NC1633]|nr:hypothetical protein GGR54DRAFT_637855 [Hypoxylon sp. NC1633]
MHIAAQRTSHTPNRKRACTECARARERCSRDEPCLRCSSKSLPCLYPDDAAQRSHLASESSTSPSNEYGQLEDHPHLAPRKASLLPKQTGYITSDPTHKKSFNEDAAPLHEFIHTLRSPSTSSYAPNLDRASSLLYKSADYRPERRSRSSIAHASAGGEPGGFVKQAGGQAPLFDQPSGPPFDRPRMHDTVGLDEAHFGQYSDILPPDPPFDYHSDAMESSPQAQQARAQGSLDSFLAIQAEQQQQQQQRGGGADVLAISNAEGLSPTTASIPGPQGLLTLSDFGSRPINLKAYEVIASHFKELRLEQGGGVPGAPASSNNISESQRTAQHELFVKLYYEHFKQQAY